MASTRARALARLAAVRAQHQPGQQRRRRLVAHADRAGLPAKPPGCARAHALPATRATLGRRNAMSWSLHTATRDGQLVQVWCRRPPCGNTTCRNAQAAPLYISLHLRGAPRREYARARAVDGIDFAAVHLWPDNWARTDMQFSQNWLWSHLVQSERRLGKPLVLEEYGKDVGARRAPRPRFPRRCLLRSQAAREHASWRFPLLFNY